MGSDRKCNHWRAALDRLNDRPEYMSVFSATQNRKDAMRSLAKMHGARMDHELPEQRDQTLTAEIDEPITGSPSDFQGIVLQRPYKTWRS